MRHRRGRALRRRYGRAVMSATIRIGHRMLELPLEAAEQFAMNAKRDGKTVRRTDTGWSIQ